MLKLLDAMGWKRPGTRLLGMVATLAAAAVLGGCAGARAGATGPGAAFREFEGRRIEEVRFEGDLRAPRDSLAGAVQTQASRCRGIRFLPFCPAGRDVFRFSSAELARDVLRLGLFYRDRGFYGTQVTPAVREIDDGVEVTFRVAPGDRVVLDALLITGIEGVLPEEPLRAALPQKIGEPFRRIDFLASADTIRRRLLDQGYAYAQVLRNYSIDPVSDVAEVEYVVDAGETVRVDTVLIIGADRLTEQTVRRQLTFREGDLLRGSELARSQRNLFDLELVRFASVEMAPDSLSLSTDSSRATVVVRVVEDAKYAVDLAVGYGTTDCLRGEVAWTNRDFLGGGRRLDVAGRVRKVGAGRPLQAGLQNTVLCRALDPTEEDGDRFGDRMDYRLAATVQQPRLFGTQNQLSFSGRIERVSEFDTFLRDSRGGQVAVTRELAPQTLLTATLDIENGRTDADTAVFCIGFQLCTPEDIGRLQQFRWTNALGLTLSQDRARFGRIPAEPLGGYALRAATALAAEPLGSDDRYLSALAQGTMYRQVRPNWVLAGRLQVGRFFRGEIGNVEEYVPPERRFYAGGPNSVRGFGPSELGPRAYIALRDTVPLDGLDFCRLRDGEQQGPADARVSVCRSDLDEADYDLADGSATGGTDLIVATVELRLPSPFLGQFTRLAAFVDAGRLGVNDREGLFEPTGLKITPGVGIRFATPVGPLRVDAAYNGYALEGGPLYLLSPNGGGIVRSGSYTPPDRRSLLNRVRLQLAVGQPF